MNPEVQINFFFEIDFGRVWLQLRWMSRLKMSFFTSIHRIGSVEVPKDESIRKSFFHRLLKVEISIGLAFVELNSQNKFHQKIVKYYHHFDCTIVFFARLFHVISRPVDRWSGSNSYWTNLDLPERQFIIQLDVLIWIFAPLSTFNRSRGHLKFEKMKLYFLFLESPTCAVWQVLTKWMSNM